MDLPARIDAAAQNAIAQNRIVGAVILVHRDGEAVHEAAYGFLDREAGTPMRTDAIFRLASVTKPLVAATILAMEERGLVGLDDPVTRFLPYFTPALPDGTVPEIRIRHLLTHSSGLSYDRAAIRAAGASSGMDPVAIPLHENLRRLATLPLQYAPGTGWLYSVAIDVLGGVAAKIHGGTLEEAVVHYVTGPLGMVDTLFRVTDPDRLAPPYFNADPEPVRMGESWTNEEGTTFVPGRIFLTDGPQSGGSGMAGTAPDLIRFLDALRAGGAPILSEASVAAGLANQLGAQVRGPDSPDRGFGFFGAVLDDPAAADSPANPGTVDWGGIWGHSWFIDRTAGLTAISCTNTVPEGCNGPFREELRNAVYG